MLPSSLFLPVISCYDCLFSVDHHHLSVLRLHGSRSWDRHQRNSHSMSQLVPEYRPVIFWLPCSLNQRTHLFTILSRMQWFLGWLCSIVNIAILGHRFCYSPSRGFYRYCLQITNTAERDSRSKHETNIGIKLDLVWSGEGMGEKRNVIAYLVL